MKTTMRPIISVRTLLLSILVLLSSLSSVKAEDTASVCKVNIFCNTPDAKIMIDTINIGNAPIYDYSLNPGTYTLLILPASGNQWEEENYRRTVEIVSDTTFAVNFERFYFINSEPFNASVFLNDSLLGKTPLRLYRESPISGKLKLKKEEYRDEILTLSETDTTSSIFVKLKEVKYGQSENIVFKNRKTDFKTKRNILAIGSFSAGALLGGISAIYHKNIANESYDTYRQTLNPADLNKTNRNDTLSLVSLIVMQGAIAGLIYFLFFD